MTKSFSVFLLFFYLISCNTTSVESKELINTTIKQQNMDTITFGAGCFWCVEAIFSDLNGVDKVISGYAGGTVKNPSYKEVCTGSTGHAEVCQVIYNPEIITYKELLEVFWQVHDPTTLNRQGGDVGTQYRSAIFYHTNEQKEIAEEFKKVLNNEKVFPNPIVTEITAFTNFFPAEDYHQDYFELNGENPYCQAVVRPKLEKFRTIFKDKLKR
jgi:peptide-methionine (S)-S-oxide reductase